ncbi:membrane protein [Paenibacillus darwinianus]|uniref:Probable membrane transporter protein n=1 Tax=Paenibacillus darwinianus TaxID=1380763 RepID=A0A9W5S0Z1_9BACL|nr:sulfite exporter TauE/SafE family protein [Paenibacillus darwinianus]EXX86595.1 membrane protein [Paenibacillus darwinianus]EXX87315.1 membrane protein [Paenibacillus darwinianus]EXX87327.1 membrane protein [Paenibacillus darwinianus]
MDILLFVTMLLLGLVGSFFSGLLGIGGAILNYPLLLFVPSGLGLVSFTAQEVATISIFQVFFASLAGVIAFRTRGDQAALVHKGLVLYMGGSIWLGSLVGGFGSRYLQEEAINILYGTLAVIAVVLMLIPSRVKQDTAQGEIEFNKVIASAAAFMVGIVSGVVGAGGAFILIPIMLTVLKIPARVTIASSLAIVFVSAIGGAIGKITAGPFPVWPTVFVVLGSLIGAPLGSRVSSKIDVRILRYGLVVLIAATAVKVWVSILWK